MRMVAFWHFGHKQTKEGWVTCICIMIFSHSWPWSRLAPYTNFARTRKSKLSKNEIRIIDTESVVLDILLQASNSAYYGSKDCKLAPQNLGMCIHSLKSVPSNALFQGVHRRD